MSLARRWIRSVTWTLLGLTLIGRIDATDDPESWFDEPSEIHGLFRCVFDRRQLAGTVNGTWSRIERGAESFVATIDLRPSARSATRENHLALTAQLSGRLVALLFYEAVDSERTEAYVCRVGHLSQRFELPIDAGLVARTENETTVVECSLRHPDLPAEVHWKISPGPSLVFDPEGRSTIKRHHPRTDLEVSNRTLRILRPFSILCLSYQIFVERWWPDSHAGHATVHRCLFGSRSALRTAGSVRNVTASSLSTSNTETPSATPSKDRDVERTGLYLSLWCVLSLLVVVLCRPQTSSASPFPRPPDRSREVKRLEGTSPPDTPPLKNPI